MTSDQDDDSRQYWKQPDPPAKEKEPGIYIMIMTLPGRVASVLCSQWCHPLTDGSGLVMDAHKTLRNEDDEEIKDTTVAKTTGDALR